jgi:hypothetical protein
MIHIICYVRIKFNILHDRYTEELKNIHGPELKDTRLVPFIVDATGRGTLHGRYVKVSNIFYEVLLA